MSLVTAIIPAYNAAAHLGEALDSVAAQTAPVAEVIVIDDGSQDDSAAIAARSGATVLSTGGRRGQAAARNLGVGVAKTPFLAFLDADDIWLPNHCETLLSAFTGAPDVVLAFGGTQRFGDAGDIPTPMGRANLVDAAPLPELLWDNPIAQSATMVRRDMFLEVGGYREGMRFAEDYDLWLRLGERYRFATSGRVTCRSRVHSNQLTGSLASMVRGAWEARLGSRQRLIQKGAYHQPHARMLAIAAEDDLKTAWTEADLEALTSLLAITADLPEGAALARRIRSRIRLLRLRRLTLGIRRVARGR